MKPREGKAIYNNCLKLGYLKDDGDNLHAPGSPVALRLSTKTTTNASGKRKSLRSPEIKSADMSDARNIRNKAKYTDMFDRMVKIETGYDIWNEYYFNTERQYRIDKAIPELKIAIEVNGGIHSKGNSGHSSGTGIRRDMDKANLLQVNGWRLLSVEPREIENYSALRLLKALIAGI